MENATQPNATTNEEGIGNDTNGTMAVDNSSLSTPTLSPTVYFSLTTPTSTTGTMAPTTMPVVMVSTSSPMSWTFPSSSSSSSSSSGAPQYLGSSMQPQSWPSPDEGFYHGTVPTITSDSRGSNNDGGKFPSSSTADGSGSGGGIQSAQTQNMIVIGILIALIIILCLILGMVTIPPILAMIQRRIPVPQKRIDRRYATIDGWLITKVRFAVPLQSLVSISISNLLPASHTTAATTVFLSVCVCLFSRVIAVNINNHDHLTMTSNKTFPFFSILRIFFGSKMNFFKCILQFSFSLYI